MTFSNKFATLRQPTHIRQFTNGCKSKEYKQNHPDYAQLTEHINDLFHHQPTYSDRQIAHRIQEEHSLYTTANQVQEIRLLHHWHRRENDPELREAARAETEQFIHQLLLEGQIRSYGRRQLITHLARKYGYRPQGRHVRTALKTLDSYAQLPR